MHKRSSLSLQLSSVDPGSHPRDRMPNEAQVITGGRVFGHQNSGFGSRLQPRSPLAWPRSPLARSRRMAGQYQWCFEHSKGPGGNTKSDFPCLSVSVSYAGGAIALCGLPPADAADADDYRYQKYP